MEKLPFPQPPSRSNPPTNKNKYTFKGVFIYMLRTLNEIRTFFKENPEQE
jgi:hypothetical protein